MAFDPNFLDEIRTRISVSSVVGRRAKLIKRGREYVCLSPFSNEKSPSFTINDDKGFYHCFSTGEHGDIFRFLMKTQNLTFPEAVERLAEEAGLEMPRQTREEVVRAEQGMRAREAVEAACILYEQALYAPEGRRALEYLRGRGLTDETIREFRLGYSPNGNVLKKKLLTRGFPEKVLLETRLLSEGKDGRESFDFFRDRVMFPILDLRSRPVAFGGRIMGDGEPKYLNSPDTQLFHKGQMLYGHALARTPAAEEGEVIVAEGYMDVIALSQAGFKYVVAPLGTALTDNQLELLWRLAPEPTFCFDGDRAGRAAAIRAANKAIPLLRPGLSVRITTLPEGKDPDDICRSEGREAMRAYLANATSLSEFVFMRQVESTRKLDTPERKAGFERDLLAKANEIADATVRLQYRRYFQDRLFELFRPPAREMARTKSPWIKRRRIGVPLSELLIFPNPIRLGEQDTKAVMAAAQLTRDRILVCTLLNHPGIRDRVEERLGSVNFSDKRLDTLRQVTLSAISEAGEVEASILKSNLINAGFSNEISDLEATAEVHAGFAHRSATDEDAAEGWDDTYDTTISTALINEVEAAEKELAESLENENFDGAVAMIALEKLNGLLQARASFSERLASLEFVGKRISSKEAPDNP